LVNIHDDLAAVIHVTGGSFRLLDQLLTQLGRILEFNELKVVTRDVVDVARRLWSSARHESRPVGRPSPRPRIGQGAPPGRSEAE
jgi:hypothetical protein